MLSANGWMANSVSDEGKLRKRRSAHNRCQMETSSETVFGLRYRWRPSHQWQRRGHRPFLRCRRGFWPISDVSFCTSGGAKAHPEHDGVDDEVGGGRTATESCSHAVAGVGGGASIRRIPAFLPRTTRWRSRGGAGDGQRPCRRRQRRRGRPCRRREILATWRRSSAFCAPSSSMKKWLSPKRSLSSNGTFSRGPWLKPRLKGGL